MFPEGINKPFPICKPRRNQTDHYFWPQEICYCIFSDISWSFNFDFNESKNWPFFQMYCNFIFSLKWLRFLNNQPILQFWLKQKISWETISFVWKKDQMRRCPNEKYLLDSPVQKQLRLKINKSSTWNRLKISKIKNGLAIEKKLLFVL